MCGILGVINGEASWQGINKVCEYMLQGAVTGILRGMDSTGMFQVMRDHSVRVHKLPIDGPSFAGSKRANTLFRAADSTLATILHHRAATHGEVSYDNCHPFEHDSENNYVIGVHNGTIPGFSRREDNITFDVDSDWLYYQILKKGAKEALENVEHGAYALVWYDFSKKKMLMAVNGQRELHFAFIKDKNTMLVASEAGMLYWLASRNGLEIEGIKFPVPNNIYEFDFKDLRSWSTVPIEKKTPTYSYQGHSHRPLAGGRTQDTQRSTAKAGTNFSDMYGAAAVDRLGRMGLALDQSVELWFDPSQIIEGNPNGDIIVEYLINNAADVGKGIISGCSGVMRLELSRADMCEARVVGVRQFYKDGTPCGLTALFSRPSLIMTTQSSRIQDSESDTIPGPKGKPVSRLKFEALATNGCTYCTRSISWEEAKAVGVDWIGNTPICDDCGIIASSATTHTSN